MSEGQLALLIPIIMITLSMTVAVVFIVTTHRRRAQTLEQRHKERMAAIDKGLDLPVEPLKLAQPPSRPRYLLQGLIWLGVGLAIVFGARVAIDNEAASFGWIPAAVGLAYLIFYFVEGRSEAAAQKTTSPAALDRGNS